MSDNMNRYWVPNLNINKKVITQELQYHLGPESTVRPYTREGEDGFLITTPGECLTDEQIDDICRKSMEVWEKQAEARKKKEENKSEQSDKPLKRPLHKPIVVSRASTSQRSGNEDDRRGGDSRRRSGERSDWRRRSGDDRDRDMDRDRRSDRGDSYRGSNRR